jgi:NAD(P)-dependent dehydrogenase (short-subunit alcohol dehydrogenase family)
MQTIVITGASRGIGEAVARKLAQDPGAAQRRLVLLCRDAQAGARVVDTLRTAGGAQVDLVVGALDSTRAVTSAALALREVCPRIDVLIHNAGVWPAQRTLDEAGLEQAFVVNHLAPFLLNRLLEGALTEQSGRVVQVSAGLYVMGKPDLARTPYGHDFGALSTYATTKQCNLALLPLFAERWQARGITINALHPGVIRTDLGARPGLLGATLKLAKRLWQPPTAAAPPIVRLALAPELAGITGRYYDVDVETALQKGAADRALAEALWRQAEQLTGLSSGLPETLQAAERDATNAH